MADLFLIAVVSTVFIIFLVYKNKKYKETSYYQITKNSYSSIKYDKGKYGEYLIYKRLQHFERDGGRFLFNLYITKTNNETTEIDLLLICSKGLFVFESKNYGGWIFGNEAHKSWTQTFPKGRGRSHKEYFYNPVMQNASHIKYLKRLIGENFPIHSIIVFSDECTFKNITINSSDVSVVHRYGILKVVTQICDQAYNHVLTQGQIDAIYNKLYPYTQLSYEARDLHVNNIQGY